MRRNLSQGQVAKYAQISQSTLSELERGIIAPKTLDAIANLAQFFGTTTDYFLGLVDDPRPRSEAPLPEQVLEVVDIARDLSPSRQEELLAHAKVLAEAEREQDVREYDRTMALILALPGGETLASEIEDALRADTSGDATTALRLIDDIIARWRGRTANAELSEQQVEPS